MEHFGSLYFGVQLLVRDTDGFHCSYTILAMFYDILHLSGHTCFLKHTAETKVARTHPERAGFA